MNKTLIAILVIVSMVLVFGSSVARNALIDSVNKRMDSSEAVLVNEIDTRLYGDFHKADKQPTNVEISGESIQYSIDNEIIRVNNNDENIDMTIQYQDGEKWIGSVKGNIKVEEIDVINIDGKMKVRLENTNTRMVAVTYNLYEDLQKGRTTLNRNFTRYLNVETVR